MFGHSHVRITLGLYGYVTPGMQDDATEKMTRLFGE
jgi:hypothetical protein